MCAEWACCFPIDKTLQSQRQVWTAPAFAEPRAAKGETMQFATGMVTICKLHGLSDNLRYLRPFANGRMFWIGFRIFSERINFYVRNQSCKQSSLLNAIFNYIFDFGPPGTYLYLSPQSSLSVGRRSRPRDSRFSWLFYRYSPGGPKSKHIVKYCIE